MLEGSSKNERLVDEGIDNEMNERIPIRLTSPPESTGAAREDEGLDSYSDAFSTNAGITTFSLVFIHLALGTFGFSYMMNWTVLDAFYYSVVTTTTVGYGDYIPDTSDLHMILGSIYIWLSISVIAAGIGLFAGKAINQMEEDKPHAASASPLTGGGTDLGDAALCGTHPHEDNSRSYRSIESKIDDYSKMLKRQLALRCAFMITLFCSGVGVMWHLEPKWSLMDTIFFITVTLSSVGYGGKTPTTPHARFFMAIYILIGVVSTSSIVGGTCEMVVDNMKKQRQSAFFARKLTQKRISQMDDDNDGQVTEAEFLSFMLSQTGLVGSEDLELLRSQFGKLDVSKDGVLSLTDFSFDEQLDSYQKLKRK